MKNYFVFTLLIALFLGFTSCEDDTSDTTPPLSVEVSAISVESDYGSLTLVWTNPEEADYAYMQIDYTNAEGVDQTIEVLKADNSVIIENLTVDKDYIFTFTVYDESGNASESTLKTARPKMPIASTILNSIEIENGNYSATVSWTNLLGLISVKVTYTNAANEEAFVETVDNSDEQGSLYIDNLLSGIQNVTVVITDSNTVVSEANFEIIPTGAIKLDKSNWTIIDLSSEETAETAPNGLATAAIDGDYSTFWHTEWNQAVNDVFPHHITIDLGKEVSIDHFETFRRDTDNRGHSECQYFVSTDNVTWTDLGLFEVNNLTDNAQLQNPESEVNARYVKFVATKGAVISSEVKTFTFLAELDVYVVE